MTVPLRVAFPPVGGDIWTGGQNWLANLVRALMDHASDRIHPVLMVDSGYSRSNMEDLASRGVEIVHSEEFSSTARRKGLPTAILTGRDAHLLSAYRAHHIDVVFESADYHGWRFPVPTLSWFPDFQHQHLPHMFSRAAWWRREIGFRLTMASSEAVMVSSADAANDLKKFYPGSRALTHIVPFAVPAPEVLPDAIVERERLAAGLPARWLFLPNHFWQHKNHALAIAAVAIARDSCPDIVLACTGGTVDPRNPKLFENLQADVARRELGHNVRLMGLVPYSQVKALMQGAVALVNPSLFEGWSTPVEEAKASRTPMILSDLPVHFEQAADLALFFKRDSAEELAAAMIKVWNSVDTKRVPATESQKPLAAFANRFADAAAASFHSS